jgi:hypothetical protein
MRVAILLTLILLSACSEKTCGEMGGEIKAGAPITYWNDKGDGAGKLVTIYPTECVK